MLLFEELNEKETKLMFRQLVKKYHPDSGHPDSEMIIKLNNAKDSGDSAFINLLKKEKRLQSFYNDLKSKINVDKYEKDENLLNLFIQQLDRIVNKYQWIKVEINPTKKIVRASFNGSSTIANYQDFGNYATALKIISSFMEKEEKKLKEVIDSIKNLNNYNIQGQYVTIKLGNEGIAKYKIDENIKEKLEKFVNRRILERNIRYDSENVPKKTREKATQDFAKTYEKIKEKREKKQEKERKKQKRKPKPYQNILKNQKVNKRK